MQEQIENIELPVTTEVPEEAAEEEALESLADLIAQAQD